MKAVAAILFAFFMVWQPITAPATENCCGVVMHHCCCAPAPAQPRPAAAPAQARSVLQEPISQFLPTVSESSLLLEEKQSTSKLFEAEISISAGAVPLFRRDCALLI